MKQLRIIGAFILPRVGKHPMNSKLTIYNNIDDIENDLFGTVVRLLVVIGVYVVDYITGCHWNTWIFAVQFNHDAKIIDLIKVFGVL